MEEGNSSWEESANEADDLELYNMHQNLQTAAKATTLSKDAALSADTSGRRRRRRRGNGHREVEGGKRGQTWSEEQMADDHFRRSPSPRTATLSSSLSPTITWCMPVYARICPMTPRGLDDEGSELENIVFRYDTSVQGASVGRTGGVKIHKTKKTKNKSKLRVLVPTGGSSSETSTYHLSNARTHFDFEVSGTFGSSVSQKKVFQKVGVPIVDAVLKGYNGAIFAYGQTGSGKTYTMTGGEKYKDRGIIPRAISRLFKRSRDGTNGTRRIPFRCSVSYLQVYNEHLYDLLSEEDRDKKINKRAKLQLREDRHGDTHVCGLKSYPIENESEAMKLLFDGNMGRITSDTPMNKTSSRSHCIFTLELEFPPSPSISASSSLSTSFSSTPTKHPYSSPPPPSSFSSKTSPQGIFSPSLVSLSSSSLSFPTHSSAPSTSASPPVAERASEREREREGRRVEQRMREVSGRSREREGFDGERQRDGWRGRGRVVRLHLVDLAGSERVYKHAKHRDNTVREGMYINRSLHYLELVVVALHNQDRRMRGQRRKIASLHVPYRNSTVTNVLRGSLSGNCKTVFVAHLSRASENFNETLSTLRFAERCQSIKRVLCCNRSTTPLKSTLSRTRLSETGRQTHRNRRSLRGKIDELRKDRSRLKAALEKVTQSGRRGLTDTEKGVLAARVKGFLGLEEGARGEEGEKEAQMWRGEIGEGEERREREKRPVERDEKRAPGERPKYLCGGIEDQLNLSTMAEAYECLSLLRAHCRRLQQEVDSSLLTIEQLKEGGVEGRATREKSALASATMVAVEDKIERGALAIRRLMDVLIGGDVFIKYGKRGLPHPKFVWVSSDMQRVLWRDVCTSQSKRKTNDSTRSILVRNITGVVRGRRTDVFSRFARRIEERPACSLASFSLLTADRSLDLEIDGADDNSDRVRVEDKRDLWVEAFEHLRRIQPYAERKRRAEEQARLPSSSASASDRKERGIGKEEESQMMGNGDTRANE